jgi:hypothetical protein
LSVCGVEEFLFEVGGAGGGDVVVVEAEFVEGGPFVGAGGGEDFGADVVGEVDGGGADAAGAGVDEDFFAGFEVGEFDDAVVGGEVGDG